MRISLIVTVLDEAATLGPLLDSMAAQTRRPDEIVVADGGSTDGSRSLLETQAARLPLRVVAAPGSNISQGRNAAIREASGDVIVVTDAGVVLDRHWIEELARPFEAGSPPLVAGFFIPDGDAPFEIAMGATVLPEVSDVNPQTFLPSSRSVAFQRQVWQAVGGYPEWLDYCEDVVFDLAVRRQFGSFEFRPSALVHFRPRGSLRALARQYYQYARGDGKAGLFPRIHAIRYLTYLFVAPLIAYAGLTVSPWLWLLYVVGGLAYVKRPYQRLARRWGRLNTAQRLQAAAYVPLIRLVGDLAKMAGYPAGLVWQLAHRAEISAQR